MYKIGALEDKSWGRTFSTLVDKAKLGTERRSRSSLRPATGQTPRADNLPAPGLAEYPPLFPPPPDRAHGAGAVFEDRHGQVLNRRLSGEAVGMVVKRCVGWLGYDVEDSARHSWRAGLATSTAAAGKSERATMNQTGPFTPQLASLLALCRMLITPSPSAVLSRNRFPSRI
jgi:hypothetical protein